MTEKGKTVEMKVERWMLDQRQALPLDLKIYRSLMRIREWHDGWRGQVYVSFSGGKDSTVLLDLVRSIYPDVPGVFVDTGLEYPEIRDFVKTIDNVIWLKPKKSFRQVLPNREKKAHDFSRGMNSHHLATYFFHGKKDFSFTLK